MDKNQVKENLTHYIDILNALSSIIELFRYYERHQITEKKDIIRHICVALIDLEKEKFLTFDKKIESDLPQLFEDFETKELLKNFKAAKVKLRELIDVLKDYQVLQAETFSFE